MQPDRRGCAEACPYRLERNILQFVWLGRLQPHQSLHDLPAGGLAHAALEDVAAWGTLNMIGDVWG